MQHLIEYRNVQHSVNLALTSTSLTLHKTFMDTVGRTTLTLIARNVVDDVRDRELIVTYDYPFVAKFRKPLSITALVGALFAAAYVVGSLDVGIKAGRFAQIVKSA